MKKLTVGVIVGRFQTPELTAGHKMLIQEVLNLHTNVIVFVGNSPLLLSQKNPLPYIVREQMLRTEFPTISIHPIKDLKPVGADYPCTWSLSLDKKIREIVSYGEVTLYGSRDSFLESYRGSYPSVIIPELACPPATLNRHAIAETPVDSVDFRKGIIYANFNRFPISYTTVDIAIHNEENKWLMGVKHDQHQWRFIGGFSDPTDESFEDAAEREIKEETGLTIPIWDLKYVCSRKINDWRYEHEEDKIKTLFYVGEVQGPQTAKGADDIREVAWFTLEEIKALSETKMIVDEHAILFLELKRYLAKNKA